MAGPTWGNVAKMTVVCWGAALWGWTHYTTNDAFYARILAGVCVGVYGIWLGNGLAFPEPFGRFAEVPGLLLCTAMCGWVLIEPPEKNGVSIRKVLLKGHPDPEHPANVLPGGMEMACHLLGYVFLLCHAVLIAFRSVHGIRGTQGGKLRRGRLNLFSAPKRD
eukprot:TRINITY_DN3048_c0_g1_i2.p1 TRINITY_DN3048_c0_g1~~TRINITY_DN3048_c0_g1_i2.p1  ORF type:complete len:183 (+),score=77.11 TRINITY_DN3048_c0_g1_i2:61-549(+)